MSIVVGTLLERTYGGSAARVVVYNSWWFELLWIWFFLALLVNLIHSKLWQKKKWDLVLFPFAFSIILFGAMLTRHFAINGLLYLREGQSSNQFFSSNSYLWINAVKGSASFREEIPLNLSPLGKLWSGKFTLGNSPVSISIKHHIVNPEKSIVKDTLGRGVLGISVFSPHSSSSCFLEKGEEIELFGIHFGFESDFEENTVFIRLEDRKDEIWISGNSQMIRKGSNSGREKRCKPFVSMLFDKSSVYSVDSVSFVLIRHIPKGRIQAVPSEISLFAREGAKTSEALDVVIETEGLKRSISLFSEKGDEGKPKVIQCRNGVSVELLFGNKPFFFPFFLRLENFEVERDKNSNKPSQFKSDVVILDPEHNIEKPYSVYMNHILRYRSYRVYQYSFYDDKKGSIFLVSRDPGTPVTYVGFFLLILTIGFALFHPKSRIRELETEIGKYARPLSFVILLFFPVIMCLGSSAFHAQTEKFYYHIRIFELSGKWFLFVTGAFLFISGIRFLSKNRFKKLFPISGRLFRWAVWLGFLVFTIGLGIRWFLAGHAPWSNKYESMVFAGWASLLAGIVLSRNSRLPMICGSLLSGIVLLMAHTSSIDSTISPLPPILKSKWLILHVSIAIVSYGFFAVGTAMTFLNLSLLALPIPKRETRYVARVTTWSKITEQAFWSGLYLLTIGCILGSIWANESWGRYWGWDPKEAWSLIVILSYVMVLHLRLVIRSYWTYWLNVWAFFAFGCLLMTFFGVNRFFSGMHTYAGQRESGFPFIVFLILGIWIALSLLAYRNRKRI